MEVPAFKKGQGVGANMVYSALETFGRDKVQKIAGFWSGTGDLADNFNSFIKNYDKMGKEAVWKTFTGRQANKYGYTNLEKFDYNIKEKTVTVIFSKPNK